MLKVNGEELNPSEGLTVEKLIIEKGLKVSRVAVERNGEIVKKCDYASAVLKDGDVIEVVSFVGGG